MIPAKVVLGVAVPKVRALEPRVTELEAAPDRSPIVVPAVVRLISKMELELFTLTKPVELRDPDPERLSLPALIIEPMS